MLDFKSRLPQTREERKQYKKVKENWESVYHKKSKRKIQITTWVSLAFIIGTLILCASPIRYFIIEPYFIKQNYEIEIPEIEITTELQQSKKVVGINTSAYLQKTFLITSSILNWQKNAYEDLTEYKTIQYKYHQEAVLTIIREIEIMESMNINELSPLKPYQKYTMDYYGKAKKFFQAIEENKTFDSNKYNTFVAWKAECQNPFDYLVELLETNNFEFKIDETSEMQRITYKCSESSIN